MKREIANSGDLKGSRCCPGHDKWPKGKYNSRRSTKARARSKQLEHQSARARARTNLTRHLGEMTNDQGSALRDLYKDLG